MEMETELFRPEIRAKRIERERRLYLVWNSSASCAKIKILAMLIDACVVDMSMS